MNTQNGGVKIIIPPIPPLTKPEIKTEITEDIFFQVFSEYNVESVEIVSLSGISGIVLSVTLKDSPFKSSYINEDGTLSTSIDFLNPHTGKVYKKIILKYCIISSSKDLYKFSYNGITYEKHPVSAIEFNGEYEIQKKIFQMTMETSGNPTCPDPFGKFIFKKDKYNPVAPTPDNPAPTSISSLLYDEAKLLTDIDIPDCDIGIIIMESLQDDFLTLGECMNINDDVIDPPDPPPPYLLSSQPMSNKKKLYDSLSLFFTVDGEIKNDYIHLNMIAFASSIIVTTLWKSGIMTYDGHSNNFLVDLSFFDIIIAKCNTLPDICKDTNPNDIKIIDLGRVQTLFLTDQRYVYRDVDGYIEFFFLKLTVTQTDSLCKMFVVFFGKYEPSIMTSRTKKEHSDIQLKKLDYTKLTYIDIQKLFKTEIGALNEIIMKDTEKLGENLYSDEGSINIIVDSATSEEMSIDSGMMLIHRIFLLSFFIDYFINYFFYETKIYAPQSFHLFIPMISNFIRHDKTNTFVHHFFYQVISSNNFRINLKSFIDIQKDSDIKKRIILFYKNMKEIVKIMMKPNMEERGVHKDSFLKELMEPLSNIQTPRGTVRPPGERIRINEQLERFISGYGKGGPEGVLPKKLPPITMPTMLSSKSSIPPPTISKLPDAIKDADILRASSIVGNLKSLRPLPDSFKLSVTPSVIQSVRPSSFLPKLIPLPPISISRTSSGGSRYKKLKMKKKIKQKNSNNNTKKNSFRVVRNKRIRKSKKIIKYNYTKVMKTRKK